MLEAAAVLDQMEADSIVHRTPCGDGHMVWHEWGAGEPLVLLHGGSGSWTHWVRNIPILKQHYRVICADTPGLGDSAMPPDVFSSKHYPASMRMLAGVFAEGLDHIIGAVAPYHLCGFSMGSIAGAYLAVHHVDRVRSFTLVGASSFGIPWNGLERRLEAMTEAMSDAERLETQRRNLRIIMTHGEADTFAGYVQLKNVERARIRTHGLPYSDTIMHALPDVSAPIAGIWGRHDVFAQPNLETSIPNILNECDPEMTFKAISDAGHWVMYEQAEAFNAELTAVINRANARFALGSDSR